MTTEFKEISIWLGRWRNAVTPEGQRAAYTKLMQLVTPDTIGRLLDAADAWNQSKKAEMSHQVNSEHLHPATHALVVDFSRSVAAKLKLYEVKHPDCPADGWKSIQWAKQYGNQCLIESVSKGDPLDVAAYAAFMWWHGLATEVPKEVQTAILSALVSDESRSIDEVAKDIKKTVTPDPDDIPDAEDIADIMRDQIDIACRPGGAIWSAINRLAKHHSMVRRK